MHLIASEGPLLGLIIDLNDGKEWIVGRDPDQVDFILEDKTVSRKHARIYKTNKGVFVQNLSKTNPIEVNEIKVDEDVLLEEGDKLKIGHNIFTFSNEDSKNEFEEENEEIEEAPKTEGGFDNVFEDLEPEEIEIPKKKKKQKKQDTAYDTIFEDLSEEKLPESLINDTSFLLKVVSGPNAGAEFNMARDSSYIVGKDPNQCDIVFNDLSVSRKHSKIILDNDGNIFIEDLGSKNNTFVNSRSITQKTKLSPQDLISIGTTTFFVVDKDAQSETIYSPFPLSTPEIEEEEEQIDENKIEKKPHVNWRNQIIPTKHLIFAGSFVFVIFVIFLSFFSLFKSQSIDVVKKAPQKDIEKIVTDYEDVNYTYNPASGHLFIVGHVLTGVKHQELLYSLKELPFLEKIDDNVIIDELVWKNMNETLSSNEEWRGVSLYSPKAGKYILTGYIKTAKQAEELSDYINVNFPYLDRLENQIAIDDILQNQIESLLIANELGTLAFELVNGEVILSGYYDGNMTKVLTKVVEKLQTYNGIKSIKNLTIPASEDAARIDLTSKYKITGYARHHGNNYNVVANGKLISAGDILDGMKISDIKPNVIYLEKGGIKFKINYKQ
jgi:type III secretion system YscD/HrpQ family protein